MTQGLQHVNFFLFLQAFLANFLWLGRFVAPKRWPNNLKVLHAVQYGLLQILCCFDKELMESFYDRLCSLLLSLVVLVLLALSGDMMAKSFATWLLVILETRRKQTVTKGFINFFLSHFMRKLWANSDSPWNTVAESFERYSCSIVLAVCRSGKVLTAEWIA